MQPIADDFFAEIDAASGSWPSGLDLAVRRYLDAAREHLLARHDLGEPARLVNEDHADLIDRLVRKLFRLSEDHFFAENPRLSGYRLSVIAVGGYGRRELSLGSDIDLLFLHRGKVNPYIETMAESIMLRLWDARLIVGAATRTLRDCVRVGRGDLSTLTSFLDARFLIGDPSLHADLEREVDRLIRRDSASFIEAKLAERDRRHEQYGESLYLLQPNLRESVGGLRDYHTALWTAQAVNRDVRRVEHLHLHGFIDEREREELEGALDFIWRLRNELHRSGRKDDRMHFAAQERLADAFGFKGGEDTLGVEQLMRAYYIHARAVSHATSRAIEHARSLSRARRGRGWRRPSPLSVEEGFVVVGGKLEIPHEEVLRDRPARLFSVFAVAQRREIELSARAQRLVRQHIDLIDERFLADPEVAAIFRDILCAPHRVYRTLRTMNDLGVLAAYIPEFELLIGLWQNDMYHTYTVDVHSLFLIEQLRRLLKGRYTDELPLATKLMSEVDSPLILYLGCLLHDIGKGRGGAHSARGAALAGPICRRLGLDDAQTAHVEFLVLHHLLISSLAESRDVNDWRLILNVANTVESRSRLRNLYLLTIADIRSVSAEAWTSWRGGRIEALYRNTAQWLEAGGEDESAPRFFVKRAADRATKTETEALRRLEGTGVSEDYARDFLAQMPRRYLLSHGPREIAQHVRAAIEFLAGVQPAALALFEPELGDETFLGLVALSRDRPGLFATVAGVLHASGHDVLGAQVYTTREGIAVEIYEVARGAGGRVEDGVECARLERRLLEVLDGSQTVESYADAQRMTRPRSARSGPPRVQIANDESDFYSIIDVSAEDRPGLLYDLTRTLAEEGLDVVMSRASTRANRVNDAFYVTEGEFKIAEPERQRRVESALLRAIEQGAE